MDLVLNIISLLKTLLIMHFHIAMASCYVPLPYAVIIYVERHQNASVEQNTRHGVDFVSNFFVLGALFVFSRLEAFDISVHLAIAAMAIAAFGSYGTCFCADEGYCKEDN